MGGKQLGFSDYEQSTAKKRTKKEKFLAEMDQVVPWQLRWSGFSGQVPSLTLRRGIAPEKGVPTHEQTPHPQS